YRMLTRLHPSGEHPVDRLVSRMPDVRRVDRAARVVAARFRSQVRDDLQEMWIKYEDLRLAQCGVREERFFDVGYEFGHLAGAAESHCRRQLPALKSLRKAVERALAASPATPVDAAVVLLATARALLVKNGSPRRRS